MAALLELGPIDQMVGVHTYNHKTLGFKTTDDAAQKLTIECLTTAAGKLVSHFPWLSGQVINEGATATSSGTFKVIEYPPHQGPSKFVRVFDAKDSLAPYDDILKAKAPASMLPGNVLSEDVGFPISYPSEKAMPVFKLRVHLLQGGILLTFCAQHNVMDANGDSSIIAYFARLCAGGEFTADEIAMGNTDRTKVWPATSTEEEYDPLTYIRAPSMLPFQGIAWPPQYGNAPWVTFRIPASSIAKLKAMAAPTPPDASSEDTQFKPWFSTDDILTALIWKHMIRARGLDLTLTSSASSSPSAETKTGLVRAVNGRTRADPPLPKSYVGHVVTAIWTYLTFTELSTMPLPSIAMTLRKSLVEGVTAQHMRSLVHLMRTTPNKTTINYGASSTPNDVMITSHVGHGIYECDFGEDFAEGWGFGKPDFVRRPNLPDAPGIVYLMPRGRDGSVVVEASLDRAQVERLREGEGSGEWEGFVEFIG